MAEITADGTPFTFTIDVHEAVNIVCDEQTTEITDRSFDAWLTKMLPIWKDEVRVRFLKSLIKTALEQNQRSVWVHMTLKTAFLVPVCARHGFTFHHALNGLSAF